jgi:hypothetical protein
MAAEYDATEFVDTDFQAHKTPGLTAGDPLRAPTREEVDRKVVEAQQKLAELKRAQEDLERERASLGGIAPPPDSNSRPAGRK